MSGVLRALSGTQRLSPNCAALLIIVPGIGTDPFADWRKSPLVTSLEQSLSTVAPNHTYFAWWDHGLPASKILDWQSLHESANALLIEILRIMSDLVSKQCPLLFVGHSVGGILIKETLRLWDQNPNPIYKKSVEACVVGTVLLGTPHTLILQRAFEFCKNLSLAFLGQRQVDGNYPENLVQLSKAFEALSLPTFSVIEIEPTRLGTKLTTFKRNKIVDRELARFGTLNEHLWPVNCSHRDLCHIKVDERMRDGLQNFIFSSVDIKRNRRRGLPPSGPASIVSRLSLRSADSEERGFFVRSEEQSPVSQSASIPTSIESIPAPSDKDAQPARAYRSLSRNRAEPLRYRIPPKVDVFFDRPEILKPLEVALQTSNAWQDPDRLLEQVRAFALCGGSGLGKSTVANHYVHAHMHRYDAILWINAEDVTKLYFAFTEISFKLGIADQSKPHDMLESQKLVRNWLHGLYQPSGFGQRSFKWLVIFDNVKQPEDLRDFWPARGGGDILITSQCSLSTMNDFSGQFGTEVQPFDTAVAIDFFNHLTEEQIQETDQLMQAAEVAEVLGGSPLALVSLSTLLKQGKLDANFVRKYTQRRESFDSSRSRPDLSGEAFDQVASVVQPLLENLKQGQVLVEVLSLLDPDGVHEWILEDAAYTMGVEGYPSDPMSYLQAKVELIEASLLSEQRGELLMHRLVQDATKSRMSSARLQEIFEGTVRMMLKLWPTMTLAERHNKRRWGIIDVLLRHVRKLHQLHESTDELNLSLETSIAFVRLLNDAGWCMYERGNYVDAKQFASQARGILKELEDPNTSDAPVEIQDLLSNIYYTLGAIAQTTHDHRESLDRHGKLMVLRRGINLQSGKLDALLAQAYNEIGNDFMTTDESPIAISFYERSIEIYESVEDFKKFMLALPSTNLGLAYWLQGKHDKAYRIVREALDEQERALGPDDGLTMKTGRLLYALGNITYSQGLFEESLGYHQRALAQFEKTVGINHNRTCDVQYRLADHHARRGNFDKAIKTLDGALQIVWNRQSFEREKARIMFKKGSIMKASGEYTNAALYEQYFKRAAETFFKYRGERKTMDELTEKDFDGLVMFWSR